MKKSITHKDSEKNKAEDIEMEKREKRLRILGISAICIAIFNAMLYFSMRTMWSGVRAMLGGKAMPLIVMGVLVLAAVFAIWAARRKKLRGLALCISIAFFGALMFMLYMAFGALPFIWAEFWRLGLGLAALCAFGLMVFRLPLGGRKLRALRALVVLLVCFVAFFAGYGLRLVGGFSVGPAVFAVEENYQIVFTTRADSIVWVEVGGKTYYDTYNGSSRSETTVHKIEVPMAALDGAKGYTIGAQTVLLRGPYDGILGRTYTQEYMFKPVDESDGLQYYAISDTHDYTESGIATARYYGDQLDFLVLAGDHASFINREADLTRALVLAHGATGGSHPVVYARGNHEVKGNRADELDRYVGADEGRFYYTFRLGSLWGVVLDMGEDHADDWWEFYGTAHFEEYRAAQIEFLREIEANRELQYYAEGVETRIAICHMPLFYESAGDYGGAARGEIVKQLNKMNIDMMISGHTHQLFWVIPNGGMPLGKDLMLQDDGETIGSVGWANFAGFICSTQTDGRQTGGSIHTGAQHTGLALEYKDKITTVWYTNSKGEIITLHDAFTGQEVQSPILAADNRPKEVEGQAA